MVMVDNGQEETVFEIVLLNWIKRKRINKVVSKKWLKLGEMIEVINNL